MGGKIKRNRPGTASIGELAIQSERKKKGLLVDVDVLESILGGPEGVVVDDGLDDAAAGGLAGQALFLASPGLDGPIGLDLDNEIIPDAPHEILLILDGSTGQNAFEQAKQFTKATEVNALAVTKLDGTAKGGVVIGISDQFKIPVKYIGIGEQKEDLQIFDKEEFVDSLFK